MDCSSSEEDEVVEDFFDPEDDVNTPLNHDGTSSTASEVHCDMSSMQLVSDDLLAIDGSSINSQDPYLGKEFESDSAARAFYSMYALHHGFGIRVARSRSERRKGIEVLVMKRFVCLKEGHHKKKNIDGADKKKRKRFSIRDGCPAMMEVVLRGPDKWRVTKLVLDHNHVVVSADSAAHEFHNRHVSAKQHEHESLLRAIRLKVFEDGYSQWLLDYFRRMQVENAGFFYSLLMDSVNCLSGAIWVNTKAKIAYTYFGDAVSFDTTYTRNENMIPFVAFSGVNHHGDQVLLGCALILDKTEASYTWLFQTWLSAMSNRPPVSFTTDQGRALYAAVSKVFPQTNHRLCRWRILSRCKKKLTDVYSQFPMLHQELKRCIVESDTVDMFEMYWGSILDKYELRENEWLQLLYNQRSKWIPAHLTNSFYAELSVNRKGDTVDQFYQNSFDSRVSLQTFILKFNQEDELRCVKEEKNDLAVFPSEQSFKTTLFMEKQAASLFTLKAFETFQIELVESLQYYIVTIQDGPYSRFYVERAGDAHSRHMVYLCVAEKKAWCNCYRFAFSGIPCRHVLRVFTLSGVVLLPEHCFIKRWTRIAKSGPELDNKPQIHNENQEDSLNWRFDDLVRDAIRCVEKGALSPGNFKVAKEALWKAILELTCFEKKLIGR